MDSETIIDAGVIGLSSLNTYFLTDNCILYVIFLFLPARGGVRLHLDFLPYIVI